MTSIVSYLWHEIHGLIYSQRSDGAQCRAALCAARVLIELERRQQLT